MIDPGDIPQRSPAIRGEWSARGMRVGAGASPVDEAHAVRLRVLRVHGAGGDGAHLARPVRDTVLPSDEGEGAVLDEQARVELMRVRRPAHVRFDFALADLVAIPTAVGLELDPGHRVLLASPWYRTPREACRGGGG